MHLFMARSQCFLATQLMSCSNQIAVYEDMKEVNRKYFNWGECDDQSKDCEALAMKGRCSEDPMKMNSLCPWSCHKCAPEKLGKYRDYYSVAYK